MHYECFGLLDLQGSHRMQGRGSLSSNTVNLSTQSWGCLPANFLPFGFGDTLNPVSDDGSSPAISLQQPFRYFGRTHSQIFVNNNGHLTFAAPRSSYTPIQNPGIDIIAPFWTDLDNRRGGTISYRQDKSSAVLAQVTAAVKQYFPNITFSASSAFVATWANVPYYNGGGVLSFQVVLVSSVHGSFILINYGDMAATRRIWRAGYNTADSVNSFTIPVTNASELSSSSNINVNGRWSFQVDGSPNCKPMNCLIICNKSHATGNSNLTLPAHFFPFGSGEMANIISDVGSSEAIVLQQPFKFFGRTHNQIFVNNNGHLTFTEPLSAYNPSLDSGRDIIAPLWTHLDSRRGGTISYREDTSSAVLAQVTAAVNQYFPNLPLPFNTTSAFVATWNSVPYSSGEGALYDTVDSAHSSSISLLTASELSSNSNVNVNGQWVFHVYDVCDTLGCTGNEVCNFRDDYGCGCMEGQRPNPETFDATEVCASSTGTMSLSRCQLFESDFPLEILHLNDPNCTGTVEDGRVLFHFDNEVHICGTTLSSNGTHFIYQNSIHSNLPAGIISRQRWVNIAFSCEYPLIQTLSMPMDIQAQHR
ncbi:alpha-tectorin-like [Rhinichthys klamathensis goyatoka]|uniref:alpha-tectorin-like n=1 Tax=Rhinichthys klamathensis goyatoka TaxID=3034132 RepID=UPI0024B4B869|nr:alpha-tectorin-like [Rhinichthys klamathensis goyatoka]